jgi:hypothetical protein
MLTKQERAEYLAKGSGWVGSIGGQPKKRYFTPDGREVLLMPQMREFAYRKDGKLVQGGLRDANLDMGLLETKPTVLKIYCPHCDKWHDTQELVDECGRKKQEAHRVYMEKAKKELKSDDRVAKLENDVSEMKDMFKKLMEKLNG